MIQRILSVVFIAGLLMAFGCSNPAAPEQTADEFFGTQGPYLTGVIGNYTFTWNDGTIETGQLVGDEEGRVTAVPDRGASVFSNYWFDVDVEYLNPRGYTGMGLPYYYVGDTFTYKLMIDYKRGLPLDLYPLLYSVLKTEQRYWPSMALLPGDSIEIWDPFLLAPYEYREVYDDFTIVSGTIPGNDATVIDITLWFFCGNCTCQIAYGVCGLWDP